MNDAYKVSSIDRLFAIHNDGDDGSSATEDMRKGIAAITSHVSENGGKARAIQVITIVYDADAKGIDVSISSTIKTPKRPSAKSRYFAMPKGDELTLQNPNRDTMFPNIDLGRQRLNDAGDR